MGTLNSTKVINFPENKLSFVGQLHQQKTLGITFYNDTNMILKNNLEPKFTEFKNCPKL